MSEPSRRNLELLPLGIARVAIGALILLRTTPLLSPFDIAFLRDAAPLLHWPSASFSFAWLPAEVIQSLCVVRTLGALALMVGVWPRSAGVLCGLSGYLAAAQSPLGVPNTLQLLYESAVLLGVSDAGAVLALRPSVVRAARSSTWLLRGFVASVYLWAGLFKLRADWLDGRTLSLLHQAGALHGSLPGLLLGELGAASFAAWSVAIFELCVGPMLLWSRTRALALALAYSFHVTVALTAAPDFLGWGMMALLSCFWVSDRPPGLELRCRPELSRAGWLRRSRCLWWRPHPPEGTAMKLADTHYDNSESGCCARLDVAKWDGKTLVWDGKPFLKDHMRALLHIPLDFGAVISRDHALVEKASAYPEDPIWLTDEVSPWGAEILMALDRDQLAGAEVEKLSGTFLTKVFEGPYRNAGKWMHAMEELVRSRGQVPKKLYTFYATCPSCAKRLGKNQAVLFAQLA